MFRQLVPSEIKLYVQYVLNVFLPHRSVNTDGFRDDRLLGFCMSCLCLAHLSRKAFDVSAIKTFPRR